MASGRSPGDLHQQYDPLSGKQARSLLPDTARGSSVQHVHAGRGSVAAASLPFTLPSVFSFFLVFLSMIFVSLLSSSPYRWQCTIV